ncbi:MAG: hypothetical protein ACTSWZ_05855 [Candidatus Heimdallarchaeaceae archaeon]
MTKKRKDKDPSVHESLINIYDLYVKNLLTNSPNNGDKFIVLKTNDLTPEQMLDSIVLFLFEYSNETDDRAKVDITYEILAIIYAEFERINGEENDGK